jgi:hypothetical protein
MIDNDRNNLEGKLVLYNAEICNCRFYAEAHHDFVEKEEEKKTSPKYSRLIYKVKDIDHGKNHWYNLVHIGFYHKHYKRSTYHDFIECYTGETTHDPFNVNVTDDPETGTEIHMEHALNFMMGWIHLCIFWFIGWTTFCSGLN